MGDLQQFYNNQWNMLGDFIRYNPGSRHRRRYIARQVARLQPKSILDVGCGNAELILMLLQAGYSANALVGCDLSGEVVCRNQKMISGVRFFQLDIEKSHLAETFDLIIFSEVIEHLMEREKSLANIRKMLLPGGYCLLTCPSNKVFDTEKAFGHFSHPTPSDLKILCVKSGLEVIDAKNWGWPVYLATKYLINLNPALALRNLAYKPYSPISRVLAQVVYLANFLNFADSPSGCQQFLLLRGR